MAELGYINGVFTPIQEIQVSAEDRGYNFGDGVYEVTRVHKGRPFALSYHEDRLYRSLRECEISARIFPDELTELHEVLIEQSGITEGYIYMQITRGEAPRTHSFHGKRLTPNVLMWIREVTPEMLACQQGVKAIEVEYVRWLRCDIKSLNLLPNVLAHTKAEKAGAYAALQYRDGICTEGDCCNFFVVKDGILYTHPANNLILKGITRTLILTRVAPSAGVTVIEREFDKDFVADADEAFFTDTVGGIIPVLTISNKTVGNGEIGRVTTRLMKGYQELMDEGLA